MVKWEELTPEKKKIVTALVALDLVGKAASWHYIYHLPAKRIRGPKWLWALVTTVVGTFGPLAFFVGGLRCTKN